MTIKTNLAQGTVTIEQLNNALPYISAIVKQVMGVANNIVYVSMTDALYNIKQHPRYKQNIKQAFNKAEEAWNTYEKELLNPVGIRYFHVEDMPPEVRKKYGDISDRDYYEFWQNIGWSVFAKNRAFFTMMDNKFKLSLAKHGVPHADKLCRAMTTEQLLNIACARYHDATKVVHKETGLPYDALDTLFGCFNLKRLHERWAKAMTLIVPNFPLDEVEDKNLRMSVEQLYEIIADIPEMYEGIGKSTEDYQEVFRTKGEWKKALREIEEDTISTKKIIRAAEEN